MAGISILRRLLMKEAMIKNAPFQNEGIMSISKALATNIDSKVKRIVEGAKRQGIDFDKYNEQEIKYILELNKKKLEPRVISADSPEGRGITKALLGRKEGKVIKADFGKPFKEEVETMRGGKKFPTAKDPDFKDVGPFDNDAEKLAEIKMSNEGFVDDIISEVNDMETISAMKEVNKVIKREGKYKNLTDEDVDKIFKGTEDRTAGRLDDIDPEDLATGGRAGFSMGRRAFLKLMGGAAAGIGALKTGALKMFGKEGAKNIPQVVTTPPVAGKPAWFDSVVNRVIQEGDDVTKQFAYKERMQVNTKQISPTEEVTVYRDLDDGSVRINYGAKMRIDETKPYEKGNIQRASNEPTDIDLIVREGKVIEPDVTTGKGGGKTKASFEASEAEPRAVGGPEDADIEFDGIREVDNVDDLMQDVSVLEEFGTGKKLTGDKAAKAKKKQEDFQRFTEDQVEQADYLEKKYGPYDDSAMDDFASGGRVGLLSGGGVIRVMLKKLAERYGKKPSELLAVTNYKSLPAEVRKFLTKEQFDVIKKDMQSRRVEQFENLRDMVKSRQEFDRSAEALKKMGMDISDTMLPLMDKAVTPGGTTADDLLMMEQVIKNLRMKDRKLNASGGLAGMLGE